MHTATTFQKILIANRGEIACRVMRTARRMGYQTVAVFSDADRHAWHVALADEAVHIGASSAADSYLNIAALIEAARATGADAVHPGYGFLSENAAFARACEEAGLVFIGPPPQAIDMMGDKAQAKRHMQQAGVPCAPGYLGDAQDDATLHREALALGFPLLVKAVAGGGGRGMRLVREPEALQAALDGARREAQSAFGDARLMLERLIDNGRHIEIQVFADAHGNVVHMGERDCTAQRRRQKVVEETPSPVVSDAMRQAMGRDAVAAAKAVGYRGAGTVEFIVDADMRHYFLEMNTRLQVEHPVTEMVTGLDLVEWQLRVAAGERLPLAQHDICMTGHALEVRLYAEDPYAGFAPQTGAVLWWQPQDAEVQGVRVDSGIRQGDVVTPFYDPMMAKLIVHGKDRSEAVRRMRLALASVPMLGITTNARFLHDLLGHAAFREARMTTTMMDQWQESAEPLLVQPVVPTEAWQMAGLALATRQAGARTTGAWRPLSVAAWTTRLQCGNDVRELRLQPLGDGLVRLEVQDEAEQAEVVEAQVLSWVDGRMRYVLHGVRRNAVACWAGDALHLSMGVASHVFHEVSAWPASQHAQDERRVTAPVAGRLTQVAVAGGDEVSAGQALACVEAMKMEMWQYARMSGIVSAVHCKVGDQVEAGALLLEIEPVDMEAAHSRGAHKEP